MANYLREKKAYLLKKIKNYGKVTLRNILLSKKFHFLFNVVIACLITGIIFYGAYLYINSSVGNNVVVSKSEIISRVGKLTTLPLEKPDAIVRVEDPEVLRKENVFYANVKAGDYILMYPSMAVIYDLLNNTIVSEKRVEK